MVQTTPLGVRIDPLLKQSLEHLARADRRSLASLVNKVLHDFVDTHGGMAQPRDERSATSTTATPVARYERLPGRPRKPSGANAPWQQALLEKALAGRESVSIAELCVALYGHDLATVVAGFPGEDVQTQDAFDGQIWTVNPTKLPANPNIENTLKTQIARHGWVEVRDTATGENVWVPAGTI